MLVEIRIYRRHDADIMMLRNSGINITALMKEVLENYAEGKKVRYEITTSQPCDLTNHSMLRYRLNIKNPEVIKVLKGIKQGYRNQFCKMLLRDSLASEPLGVFFENDDDAYDDENRLKLRAETGTINKFLKKNKKKKDVPEKAKETPKPAPKKERPVEVKKEAELSGNFEDLQMETAGNKDKSKELMSAFEDMMSEI